MTRGNEIKRIVCGEVVHTWAYSYYPNGQLKSILRDDEPLLEIPLGG